MQHARKLTFALTLILLAAVPAVGGWPSESVATTCLGVLGLVGLAVCALAATVRDGFGLGARMPVSLARSADQLTTTLGVPDPQRAIRSRAASKAAAARRRRNAATHVARRRR